MNRKRKILFLSLLVLSIITIHAQKYSKEDFKIYDSEIYPLIKSSGPEDAISEDLTGGLKLFYGIKKESGFEIITKTTFPESITPGSLKFLAVYNLELLVEDNMALESTDFGAKSITCGGELDPSLIIVDYVLEFLEDSFFDGTLIAIPDNQSLYVIDDTPENLKKLKKITAKKYKTAGENSASDKIYTITDYKLQVIE